MFLNGDVPLGTSGYTAYFFGGATRRRGEIAGFSRRAGDDRTVRALWPNGFLPVIQSNVRKSPPVAEVGLYWRRALA